MKLHRDCIHYREYNCPGYAGYGKGIRAEDCTHFSPKRKGPPGSYTAELRKKLREYLKKQEIKVYGFELDAIVKRIQRLNKRHGATL